MKNIVVLSGAGISAESGIKTFRDADGLWEGHDVMEVASPIGWAKDQDLVLDFYNKRRAQLKDVKPNIAHKIIANLEDNFHVQVITQNVDDLHERAGSSNILHLHGELLKVRSTINQSLIYPCDHDIITGDLADDGGQLRPHIVWFGEEVPLLQKAANLVSRADILIIIGTSLQVYPAAGLIDYAHSNCDIYLIDPKPNKEKINSLRIKIIESIATQGMQFLMDKLNKNL